MCGACVVHVWRYAVPVWLSPEYIAHSARKSFADFERPLLAPQPTALDDKKRKLCEFSCSIFFSLRIVNPDTFS